MDPSLTERLCFSGNRCSHIPKQYFVTANGKELRDNDRHLSDGCLPQGRNVSNETGGCYENLELGVVICYVRTGGVLQQINCRLDSQSGSGHCIQQNIYSPKKKKKNFQVQLRINQLLWRRPKSPMSSRHVWQYVAILLLHLTKLAVNNNTT